MDRVQRELVGHRIHWKFIPDRVPWMGGNWERLVRSVKESLRKGLGQALFLWISRNIEYCGRIKPKL
ncbi:hypothetical protein T03_9622 [Trichinella britovi]|uniref:Uncharacterized protein n=1 Tax=Trichinella britovi TaxID=45882 RepID=A0A0V1B3H1_TRIBR|nr:hypothetical protein T03_9622 [Trichinella britovi]